MLAQNIQRAALSALLITSLSLSLLPIAQAATVAQQSLDLLFPGTSAEDNLAVDPGDTLGEYFIAYFARLDHIMYNQQDARRKAIALGLIERDTSMDLGLDSALVRQHSYRHRILYTDDPVAALHGSDGDIGRHITLDKYPTLKIVNDHLNYYNEKLKDTTLPMRLAETLTFRQLRFQAIKLKLEQAKPVATTPSQPSSVQLSVPYFKQERSLSCEMASLRSMLAFYGHEVKEQTLIDLLGITSPLIKEDGIWGDPQVAFVGKIDGRQSDYSGYGTYWKPVARVGKNYKPELEWFEGGNLSTITKSIDAGHPVQIWTVVPAKGGFLELKWTTPSGQEIVGFNGEHTWVVDGYTGTADKPTSFHVLDPYFGPKTVTEAELSTQWARFNNSGVKVK